MHSKSTVLCCTPGALGIFLSGWGWKPPCWKLLIYSMDCYGAYHNLIAQRDKPLNLALNLKTRAL
ncbi:hypothetical protein C7212DRAFT_313322, partial [Tuber magnatum]